MQRSSLLAVVAVAMIAAATGCSKTPAVVPVSGKVLYNGKPMPYGYVLFQPEQGQPAEGEIQSDGSFQLSSYGPKDGAVPGRHKISVRCFSGQKAGAAQEGSSPGKLMIPQKYTRFGMSGLSAEIKAGANEPVVIELEGPPVQF